MNFFKRIHPLAYALAVSFIITIIAFIIYLVNASTGYGETTTVNGGVVTAFIFAIILEAAIVAVSVLQAVGKLPIPDKFLSLVNTVALLAVGACLTVVVYFWIFMAVPWAENVWFLSSVLDYTDAEKASLDTALTGVIFVGVAYVALIVGSIPARLIKEN